MERVATEARRAARAGEMQASDFTGNERVKELIANLKEYWDFEVTTETKVAPLFWPDPEAVSPARTKRASMSMPYFFT